MQLSAVSSWWGGGHSCTSITNTLSLCALTPVVLRGKFPLLASEPRLPQLRLVSPKLLASQRVQLPQHTREETCHPVACVCGITTNGQHEMLRAAREVRQPGSSCSSCTPPPAWLSLD